MERLLQHTHMHTHAHTHTHTAATAMHARGVHLPDQHGAREVHQLPLHAGCEHKSARRAVVVAAALRQRQRPALQPKVLKEHVVATSGLRRRAQQGLRVRVARGWGMLGAAEGGVGAQKTKGSKRAVRRLALPKYFCDKV